MNLFDFKAKYDKGLRYPTFPGKKLLHIAPVAEYID